MPKAAILAGKRPLPHRRPRPATVPKSVVLAHREAVGGWAASTHTWALAVANRLKNDVAKFIS